MYKYRINSQIAQFRLLEQGKRKIQIPAVIAFTSFPHSLALCVYSQRYAPSVQQMHFFTSG